MLAALLLAGLLPGAAAAAAPPGEVRAKVKEALADPRYQHALPQHEDKPGTGPVRHRERWDKPGEEGEGGSATEIAIPVIGAGAIVTRVVFLVLLVVVGLLIAGWLLKVTADRRRRAAARSVAGQAPAAAPAALPLLSLDDASRLAAEGRYAEAVHALLLAAIRHFAERSRAAVQPSRTSRELVRTLPLAPDAREGFAELVRAVELSLFGGAPLGAADYERSLACFQALTRRAA